MAAGGAQQYLINYRVETAARLLEECARMSAGAVEDAFSALTPETARTFGARLYLETGLRGIRGEVAGGFPSVLLTGLPTLRALLERGGPAYPSSWP